MAVPKCSGECQKYKSKASGWTGFYGNGNKRCTECEIYVKWDGLWCPCCGFRLRSRGRKSRDDLRRI